MLVNQPTPNPSSYNLPEDSQSRLMSAKLESRTVSCELVGDFVSSYPIMSRDSEATGQLVNKQFTFHGTLSISTVFVRGSAWPYSSQMTSVPPIYIQYVPILIIPKSAVITFALEVTIWSSTSQKLRLSLNRQMAFHSYGAA